MNSFFSSFSIAAKALRRNRVRTALTVLGIVIGISSVITVMSAGEGIKSLVFDQVEAFGTNIIQIEIKVPSAGKTSSDNAIGMAQGTSITTLKLSDRDEINKLPNVRSSYGAVIGQQIVSYEGENKQIILFGVSSEFINIDKTEVEYGRFFTNEEDKSLVNVVLIGSKVREDLFGENDFLNKSIKIGKQKFTVIGAMKERGATFGFDMDSMIYMPVRTLQKKVMGIDHLSYITAQIDDNDIADQTADEITTLMRDLHDISDPAKDDFHATPLTEAMDILNSVFWAIELLLIAISGVSLLVGGVGIMNIMYVSVLERTYEIGLRKAVGASNTDILLQFLWEAVFVTFLGAIAGIISGIFVSWLIVVIATALGFEWRLIILPSSIVLASGVSVMIGLVFGLFPARSAARMDSITALRYNR